MVNHPNRSQKKRRQQQQYAEQILIEAKANALRSSYTWGELSERDRNVFLEEARTQLPTMDEMIARGWIRK